MTTATAPSPTGLPFEPAPWKVDANGEVIIDGCVFPAGSCPIVNHLWMFSQGVRKKGGPITPHDRYLYLHTAIDLTFNVPGSLRRIEWNEWTEDILKELIGDWGKKRFNAIAGSSSSGKSDGVALYGLMSYWSRPSDSFFIALSTTKTDARGRIWKSITELWGQAEVMGCPGKLIDSDGYIKGVNPNGKLWRNSGIILIAAGNNDADAACKTLLGRKAKSMIVGADEFNELGDGILKTAYENLTSNDRLLFAGMANPDKLTDPFGELCEPIGGWKSVTEDDYRWTTKYGRVLRLNAELSPRILREDGERFHWQPDQEYCDRIAAARGGKKSRGYYRFVKAFWCPEGSPNSIYSEVELMNGSAMDEREPLWDEVPIVLAGFDPSYSRNGDRSCTVFGKLGKVNGRSHLHVCFYATITEDIKNTELPFSHQVAGKWVKLCQDWGIKPIHAALDNTGAGVPFGHIIDKEWSPATQKIDFQGTASDRMVVFRNQDCKYFNKNSELWIQPKELIRENQISGISKELLAELVEREFHAKEGRALRVEGKDEAKKRLKRSPDLCDAFLMLVDRALGTGLLVSEEVRKVAKTVNSGWQKAKTKKSLTSTCGRRMRRG